MGRMYTVLLNTLFILVLVAVQAYSGSKCCASKSAAKACSKSRTVTESSAKVDCIHMSPEGCAKICGMTPEDCARLCGGHGNCGYITLSVEGMEGSDCEKAISTVLAKVPGVYKVINIDIKKGLAVICTDPSIVGNQALVTAIVNKGYKAEIISAKTRPEGSENAVQAASAHQCGVAAKGCLSKKGCRPGCSGMSSKTSSTDKKPE